MNPSKQNLSLPFAGVIGVLLISGLLGSLIALTLNKAYASNAQESASIRAGFVAPDELSLGLDYRSEASGWNLLEFMSYECPACRTVEPRLDSEIMEFAPNIGRTILPVADLQDKEGSWPARAVLADAFRRAPSARTSHRNLIKAMHPNKKAAMEQRPFSSASLGARMTEADWESMVMDFSVTERLTKISALTKRLEITRLPTFVLVSPSGEAWIARSLEDWKSLVLKKGLAGT